MLPLIVPYAINKQRYTIQIPDEEYACELGTLFMYSRCPEIAGLADTVTYFLFRSAGRDTGRQAHARAVFPGAQAEFLIEIYKDPTITALGTEITDDIYNVNEKSTRRPVTLRAWAGPTVTNDGTLFWQDRIGSGRNAGVGHGFAFPKVVVDFNVDHIFKITKKTTTNPAWLSVDFWFTEERI